MTGTALTRPRRVLIFANPTSGRGRGMEILTALTPTLKREGWDAEARIEHPAHLQDIGDVEDIHALIVIGGDGTLRTVIERVGQLAGLANVPPTLVMGLGTANLMQQHLGLVYDYSRLADDVADILRHRNTVLVDTSVANDRLFLLVASCGIDAAVVHELSSSRVGPITKLSYVAPALTALKDYSFPKLSVEVDGAMILENQHAMVFVGNVPEYGTGFPVLRKASSFDRRLDVCVMPCSTHHELVYLWLLTVAGKHTSWHRVKYTTGRDIRITGDPAPMQIDGDAAAMTPAHIRLLEERIAFIVR
ncbi:MAG: hypothetical protein H7144_03980 [Burkholderiales bacterium]|nr:hypothetical protein [Phycisphaerae bacterium]